MCRYWTLVLVTTVMACSLGGCSDDASVDISCDSDELYDPREDICVPRRRLSDPDTDHADVALGVPDAADTDRGPDGADGDASTDTPFDGTEVGDTHDTADGGDLGDAAACDKDHDQSLAKSCGGYDCDDNDPQRSPQLPEFCDEIDNSCSGTVNDNIDCSFYAHTSQTLYKINPFAKTATRVGTDLPYLQDIDTHPDGTLFGITRDALYRFDPWADDWVKQGAFGAGVDDPNGLAIDSDGTAFITSQDKMYTADLMTGHASLLGTTGNFYSSGDCVVDKRDTLYMTSKADSQSDKLVRVSRADGQGMAIGATGFQKIFALTAAWGALYGLTTNGELIKISPQDGSATLVTTFIDKSFWGAASTPGR